MMRVLLSIVLAFFCFGFQFDGLDDGSEFPAERIRVKTDAFDRNLSALDDTVQKALETLDDLIATGGAGTPGGATTQIQYNNDGAFGGVDGFIYNGTSVSYTGNLGIGSTNPRSKLDVDGAIYADTFYGSGAGLTDLPAAGTTDHAALSHLAYADSGHTGFEPTVTKGNLTGSSGLTVTGGTGAVIGSGVSLAVDSTIYATKVFTGATYQPIGSYLTSESDPKVGSLAQNKLPKWNTTTLVDSLIYDNGGNVGIGTTVPLAKLDVNGLAKADGVALKPTTTFTVCSSTAKGKSTCDYICDGTADDVQIQAAIDAIEALPNGGKLYLSEGYFNIASGLVIHKGGIVIQGNGLNVTFLAPTASINGAYLFTYTNNTATQVAVIMRDFTAYGYNGVNASFFNDKGGSNYLWDTILEDLYIDGFTTTSNPVIYFHDAWGKRMNRVIIEQAWGGGTALRVDGGTQNGDIKVTNCKIMNNLGSAIYLNGVVKGMFSNNSFGSGAIDGNPTSDMTRVQVVLAGSDGNVFTNNFFSIGQGITIDGTSDINQFIGNRLYGNNLSAKGVDIASGATGNNFINNYFEFFTTGNIVNAGTYTYLIGNLDPTLASATIASNLLGSLAVAGDATVTGSLTTTGNVGIGSAIPTQKLDVGGNILASGTITGSNLSGTNTGDQTTITGNAGTATALAANGTNCASGYYPKGVDASGNAEGCVLIDSTVYQPTGSYLTAVTADSPLSGSGTSGSHLVLSTAGTWSGNAGTATALASDPTDCGTNAVATAIDANGNLTCGITPLVSGGTLTSGRVCRYDGTGIDCDRLEDGSGDCAANSVCMGGHTHTTYLPLSGGNVTGNLGIGTTVPLSRLTVGAGTVLTNSIASFFSNVDGYSQINHQNRNAGTSASTDYVATADNGNDTSFYVNMGINGSGYTGGVIGAANDAYFFSHNTNKNLYVGVGTTGGNLVFINGGTNVSTSERMRIDANGNVGIGTSSPTTKLHVYSTNTSPNFLWAPITGEYSRAIGATEIVAGNKGYIFNSGSNTSTSGHGIGVFGYASDTTLGAITLYATEGRVDAHGQATYHGLTGRGQWSDGLAGNTSVFNGTVIGVSSQSSILNYDKATARQEGINFGFFADSNTGGLFNYGMLINNQTSGFLNFGLGVRTATNYTVHISPEADNTTANAGITFGQSGDTQVFRAGAGLLGVTGAVQATGGFKSSDGTDGGTGTINVRNAAGTGSCTITVKNGLMTATTCP